MLAAHVRFCQLLACVCCLENRVASTTIHDTAYGQQSLLWSKAGA